MTPIDAWVRQKLDDANKAKGGNSSPLFSFDQKEMNLCTKATKTVLASNKGQVLQPAPQLLPPFF
jgi:hypothetical protein